jgi:hypothetical protein
MRVRGQWLVLALLTGCSVAARGQDAKGIVGQAVQTELAASRDDHSLWLYYEVDRKPSASVAQWVAETNNGNLRRVLRKNGRPLSLPAQHRLIDRFIQDAKAQDRQRKAGQHDDSQATEMLRLLPNAFVWTITARNASDTTLHFRPDPDFHPPDWETRVFAAMEGDMVVDNAQHRIVSLKGRLIHDVKFVFGLFGDLKAGGTFDVERRDTGKSVWQITQTHVHIQGNALLFKNISQNEDDVLSRFQPLPGDISLQQAEIEMLKQPE